MSDFVADTELDAPDSAHARRFPNPVTIAWQRKGWLLLGLVVGVVLGVLYYSQKTPTYQSTAQVLVVKKRGESLPATPGSAMLQPVYIEDYLTTHSILIRSQELLRRAAKLLEATAPEAIPAGADPVAVLTAGLTVARETRDGSTGPSNVLNLSFRGGRSQDCPKILGAIIDAYQEFLNETYVDLNKQFIAKMTHAQQLLERDIARKNQAYEQIAKADLVALQDNKNKLRSVQERVNRLDSKRADLVLRQTEIKARKELIEKSLKQGVPRVVLLRLADKNADGKSASAAEARSPDDLLTALHLQEEELQQDFGRDHPQMIALRKRIKLLEERGTRLPADTSFKGDALDFFLQSLDREAEENEMLLKTLTGLYEEETRQSTELARFHHEEEKARQEVENLRQQYEIILSSLRQINLVGDPGGYTARVIGEAGPGAKVAPSLIQTLLFAIVLGLVGGLGLGYVAEWNDQSFHNPEEIRRRLGLPVIGHMPVINAELAPAIPGLDGRLASLHAPRSLAAESIRGLRTALYFSTQGRGHQVLQITSPHMGDGKSTLAANLAVCMAQSGKSVVLIDADFRRPRIHRFFNMTDPALGLATVITGEADLDAAIRPSAVPHLSLLPCGPRPANPAELLTSPRFQEVLNEIRDKYDFVLIDTPPLLVVSDPAVVSPRVDGVILTIRVTKNCRPSALRARELLVTLGANILGVVVNGFDNAKSMGYGYDYSYGYKYGYKYDGYEPYAEDPPEDQAAAPQGQTA
ncbi:MAG: polysaccharide biosynthesis tyrosine autokinase [Gemmataceae bacterium]